MSVASDSNSSIRRSMKMSTAQYSSYCRLFDFPPFFTIQPVDASRARQLDEWRQLIIQWAASNRISTISLASCPLWENATIQRRLSGEGIAAVVEHCILRGSAEWTDASKTSFRVFVRSPSELGTLIADHASKFGYAGSVLTLYEMHSGAPGLGTPWEGLDAALLLRALETLEAKGRAVIIRTEQLDEIAVKIL